MPTAILLSAAAIRAAVFAAADSALAIPLSPEGVARLREWSRALAGKRQARYALGQMVDRDATLEHPEGGFNDVFAACGLGERVETLGWGERVEFTEDDVYTYQFGDLEPQTNAVPSDLLHGWLGIPLTGNTADPFASPVADLFTSFNDATSDGAFTAFRALLDALADAGVLLTGDASECFPELALA